MGYRTYTCSVHRDCGGCSLLTRPYPLQLARKQEEVVELFSGFPEARIEPIIGMEEPLHFRNKILPPFASGKKGRIIHGLYRKHSHQVIAHDDCLVVDERAQPILDAIANLMPSFKMRPYDEDRREGLLRHVLIRTSRSTGEIMVTLVCTRSRFPSQKTFVKVLRERCPEISTVVLNVNGGDRVSYTYDEIDADTGEVIGSNTKESFFVVDAGLRGDIESVREYIRENKLA